MKLLEKLWYDLFEEECAVIETEEESEPETEEEESEPGADTGEDEF